MAEFNNLFEGEKPIIGMIHLAGKNKDDRIGRALEELILYEGEGVDGVIIEDYHGSVEDVRKVLKTSAQLNLSIVRGVNILINPYSGFELAQEYGAKFVQFDSVQTPDLNLKEYDFMRRKYPDVSVLGGIGFKYTKPTRNLLKVDLDEGKSRCEAIVTTGIGTGKETPAGKLREYKILLEEFPLIVGAGVNVGNVYEQLGIADGAIIGSYFKPDGNTELPVQRRKVRKIMDIAKEIR
tara:strand:- start:253 stop:963 length:711 start_codon:yes stop_codon:yes gene_type:complete